MIILTFFMIFGLGMTIGYFFKTFTNKIKNGFTVNVGSIKITVEKKRKPIFNKVRFPTQQ